MAMRTTACATLLLLLAACAAPRTCTSDLAETLHIDLVQIPRPSGHSNFTDKIVDLAAEIPTAVIKQLLKLEGKKYEANFGSTRIVSFADGDWKGQSLGHSTLGSNYVITVAREVDARDYSLGNIPSFDVDVASKAVCDALEALEIRRLKQEDLTKKLEDLRGKKVTFFAAVAMRAQEGGQSDQYDSFQMILLTYAYPALKAKSANLHIPFVSTSETKSILTVRVLQPGAKNDDAQATFEVPWNRNSDKLQFQRPKEATASRLFPIPDFKRFQLQFSVSESDRMADWIKQVREAL